MNGTSTVTTLLSTQASTTNGVKHGAAVRFSPQVEIVLTVLYLLITLSGLVLNGVISYLFFSRRLKKNSFHEYLLSLTISDILSLISIYPYILVDVNKYNLNETAAGIVCSITDGMTLFWICTSASICILCLISVNRYLLVNHPKRCVRLRQTCFVRSSIVIAWAFSLLYMTPNIFSYHFDTHARICVRRWPPRFHGTLYTYASCGIGMGGPIILMTYTLCATIRTLWFKKKITLKNSSVMTARKRVIVLLATLIVAFTFCYFPFGIYWLLAASGTGFKEGIEGSYDKHRVIRVVILFVILNPVLDPLIYGLRSYEIRRALKGLTGKSQGLATTKSFYSHSDNDSRESRYRGSTKSCHSIVIVNTAAVTTSKI